MIILTTCLKKNLKILNLLEKIKLLNKMLNQIKKNSKTIDKFLKKYFKNQQYSNLISPMKYGTLFGGKKVRSTIILNTGKF